MGDCAAAERRPAEPAASHSNWANKRPKTLRQIKTPQQQGKANKPSVDLSRRGKSKEKQRAASPLHLFFPSSWFGFCSLPSLAVTPSLVLSAVPVTTTCGSDIVSHLPLVVLLPPSRVRDAASSASGKARTRQLGTGGVVSQRIGWPARSCMPACLTVSARRLLEALNGRDALPISPGPASSTCCNLVGPLPPLRFSSLCSLSSAVWRAWLAQREKKDNKRAW